MTTTETTIDRARRENRILYSVEVLAPENEETAEAWERLKAGLSDLSKRHRLLAVSIDAVDLDPPQPPPRSWWKRLIDWLRRR